MDRTLHLSLDVFVELFVSFSVILLTAILQANPLSTLLEGGYLWEFFGVPLALSAIYLVKFREMGLRRSLTILVSFGVVSYLVNSVYDVISHSIH